MNSFEETTDLRSSVPGMDGAGVAGRPNHRTDKGPMRVLCDEIGFVWDRRLERQDLFLAFVSQLVEEIGDRMHMADAIQHLTGKPASDGSRRLLDVARNMVSDDLGLSVEARSSLTEEIHDESREINPDDPEHSCDHAVDMLASCASAIRFGLETPCRSRHAASAAQHVWKHVYGVTRFDGKTPAWEKEWARSMLQSAIYTLLPTTQSASPSTRAVSAQRMKTNPTTKEARPMGDLTFEQKKAMPGYSDGYWDAIARKRSPADASEGYRYGYEAATRARDLLTGSGFTQDGATFTKTMRVSK